MGIIEGFVEYGLAESGSWLSIVDAGILQGIQDGYTLSEGTATYSTNNPGSLLWRDFFDILESTEHGDIERIKRWGAAEQAATDYGIGVATSRNLLPFMVMNGPFCSQETFIVGQYQPLMVDWVPPYLFSLLH